MNPLWLTNGQVEALTEEEAQAVRAWGVVHSMGVMLGEKALPVRRSRRQRGDKVAVLPCGDCGEKINPAQVKASPAASEAFLRGE